ADEAANPAFKRGQQAQIAYLEGWTAARRGDYASAQKQADRINQLLAPDANPRKLEPMHQLEGFIALYQAKYTEAAAHLRQGNLLDPYIKYQIALPQVCGRFGVLGDGKSTRLNSSHQIISYAVFCLK